MEPCISLLGKLPAYQFMIACYIYAENQKGNYELSTYKIENDLNVNHHTVIRHVRRLENAGLIEIEQRHETACKRIKIDIEGWEYDRT